jgi:hypothetical protein
MRVATHRDPGFRSIVTDPVYLSDSLGHEVGIAGHAVGIEAGCLPVYVRARVSRVDGHTAGADEVRVEASTVGDGARAARRGARWRARARALARRQTQSRWVIRGGGVSPPLRDVA